MWYISLKFVVDLNITFKTSERSGKECEEEEDNAGSRIEENRVRI
jgi:hypothetical protein